MNTVLKLRVNAQLRLQQLKSELNQAREALRTMDESDKNRSQLIETKKAMVARFEESPDATTIENNRRWHSWLMEEKVSTAQCPFSINLLTDAGLADLVSKYQTLFPTGNIAYNFNIKAKKPEIEEKKSHLQKEIDQLTKICSILDDKSFQQAIPMTEELDEQLTHIEEPTSLEEIIAFIKKYFFGEKQAAYASLDNYAAILANLFSKGVQERDQVLANIAKLPQEYIPYGNTDAKNFYRRFLLIVDDATEKFREESTTGNCYRFYYDLHATLMLDPPIEKESADFLNTMREAINDTNTPGEDKADSLASIIKKFMAKNGPAQEKAKKALALIKDHHKQIDLDGTQEFKLRVALQREINEKPESVLLEISATQDHKEFMSKARRLPQFGELLEKSRQIATPRSPEETTQFMVDHFNQQTNAVRFDKQGYATIVCHLLAHPHLSRDDVLNNLVALGIEHIPHSNDPTEKLKSLTNFYRDFLLRLDHAEKKIQEKSLRGICYRLYYDLQAGYMASVALGDHKKNKMGNRSLIILNEIKDLIDQAEENGETTFIFKIQKKIKFVLEGSKNSPTAPDYPRLSKALLSGRGYLKLFKLLGALNARPIKDSATEADLHRDLINFFDDHTAAILARFLKKAYPNDLGKLLLSILIIETRDELISKSNPNHTKNFYRAFVLGLYQESSGTAVGSDRASFRDFYYDLLANYLALIARDQDSEIKIGRSSLNVLNSIKELIDDSSIPDAELAGRVKQKIDDIHKIKHRLFPIPACRKLKQALDEVFKDPRHTFAVNQLKSCDSMPAHTAQA